MTVPRNRAARRHPAPGIPEPRLLVSHLTQEQKDRLNADFDNRNFVMASLQQVQQSLQQQMDAANRQAQESLAVIDARLGRTFESMGQTWKVGDYSYQIVGDALMQIPNGAPIPQGEPETAPSANGHETPVEAVA